MKKLFLILTLAVTAFGQTILTSTTTSAAMTSTQQTMIVASATGISAGTALYIYDVGATRGELVQVKSNYSSGAVLPITRGSGIQRAHASGAYVVIAPVPAAFYDREPYGACTASAQPYLPWINTTTGNQWYCNSSGVWIPHWGTASPSTMQVISSTATASVAGATPIAGPYLKISDTNAITSFTMSAGWHGQGFCVYPTAAFTVTATNNIAKAATAVADRTLCFYYDAAAGKFSPSY